MSHIVSTRNSPTLPEIRIIETEEIDLTNYKIIIGFTGPGLIGNIAVSYIIQHLEMQMIAHVDSWYLPPAVVFIDGVLRHPFRIYAHPPTQLCAIICEIPLRAEGAYPIAHTLLDWIEAQQISEIIVLEGIPMRGLPQIRQTYCAAEPQILHACEQHGVKIIQAGMIQGLAGSILKECLTRQISGVTFMTPAIAYVPDPEGSAVLINTLNTIYNLHIDTQPLLEQADDIKQKLQEIAQRAQAMRTSETRRGTPEALYA